MADGSNRYAKLIENIFNKYYREGDQEVAFEREDLVHTAKKLRIKLPKNLGDVIYSFRYRVNLPESICKRAPEGFEWVIRPTGQAKGGTDQLGIVQIEQDFALCSSKFPNLICRSIAAQFVEDNLIALFSFELGENGVVISDEKHYRLVPPEQMTDEDLANYRNRAFKNA